MSAWLEGHWWQCWLIGSGVVFVGLFAVMGLVDDGISDENSTAALGFSAFWPFFLGIGVVFGFFWMLAHGLGIPYLVRWLRQRKPAAVPKPAPPPDPHPFRSPSCPGCGRAYGGES